MELIWLGILLLTFLLCLRSTTLGCCMLIFTRILVPEVVRLTPYASISLNSGVIGVIAIFLFKDLLLKGKIRSLIKDYYFRALVVFSALSLMTLLLGDCYDFSKQFAYFIQYCITDIFPIIAIIYCSKDGKAAKWLIYSMLLAVFINTIYGIITVIIGINPYTYAINLIYMTKPEQMGELEVSLRAGVKTTSSTFANPNIWGTFLPLAVIFHLYYYVKTKNKLFIWAVILLSICVFLSGKRTAILSFGCSWFALFFFMPTTQRIRYTLYTVISFVVILFLIYIIPQFSSIKDLIESSLLFWDDSLRDKTEVGGSSMSMRIEQTLYPWEFIFPNVIFGKGFGFNYIYISENGLHPILRGFETILSYSVTNGGIIGVFLWFYFFIKSYKYNCMTFIEKKYSFVLTFTAVVISIANGLSLIVYYGIFVVLMNKAQICIDYEKS